MDVCDFVLILFSRLIFVFFFFSSCESRFLQLVSRLRKIPVGVFQFLLLLLLFLEWCPPN